MSSTIEKWMKGKGDGGKSETSSPLSKTDSKRAPATNFVTLDYDGLARQGYIVKHANKEIIDEYRLIKRRLLKSMQTMDVQYPNIILVTSALQGDGKTFTALNLAFSLAMEVDRTVLLIDGDVIKCGIEKTLGISSRAGLVDLLSQKGIEFSQAVYKTEIENLSILPAGNLDDRSTELLSSDRMKEFCDEVSRRYPDRLIIIDSPPILQTTESQALAHILNHIVFVVSSAHTSRVSISNAMELLDREKNLQFILNKARLRSAGMYYYYGEK